jgi:hypothetical protein
MCAANEARAKMFEVTLCLLNQGGPEEVYLVAMYGQAWHLGLPSFFIKLIPAASVDLTPLTRKRNDGRAPHCPNASLAISFRQIQDARCEVVSMASLRDCCAPKCISW